MATPETKKEKMKFVVVGPGGVGKSAITLCFVRNQFLAEYDPTIEDSYSKEIEVDNIAVNLDITDTAGQEEFRGLWGDKHIQAGDGFILVFACDENPTLADLEQFKTQIFRIKDAVKVPMVICANKVDLVDTREVTEEEGKEFAENSNALYIETSAKSAFNVEEAFHLLVRSVREDRQRKAAKEEEKKAAAAEAAQKDAAGGDKKKSDSGKEGKEKKKGGCILL